MISNIVSGTQYQYDLKDLAFIGKNSEGIVFHYKQGLSVQITIDDETDRQRQYLEACAVHAEYNKQKP